MLARTVDLLIARAQVGLAFFYGVVFVVMFIAIAYFWDRLTKVDVGIMTMFATGAMNQSKDASSFFFARHRASLIPDPVADRLPVSIPFNTATPEKTS